MFYARVYNLKINCLFKNALIFILKYYISSIYSVSLKILQLKYN